MPPCPDDGRGFGPAVASTADQGKTHANAFFDPSACIDFGCAVGAAAMLLTCLFASAAGADSPRASEPASKPAEGVRVGAVWWGEWFGGVHTHSRSIEMGNSRWEHRLPARAKIVEDASRLACTAREAQHVIYKTDKTYQGILIRASFDPNVAYDPRAAIAVYTSAGGETWAPLEDEEAHRVAGRVGGTRLRRPGMACYNVGGYRGKYAGWNRVQLWSYRHYQFAPQPPADTKQFKIVITPPAGGPVENPQIQEIRLYERGETFMRGGEIIDPLEDFSKVHARSNGLAIRTDQPERFKYLDAEIDTQEKFDAELQAFIDSGMHYAAFLDASLRHPNHGWARFYFNSVLAEKIGFCVIGAVKQYDWGETLTHQRRRWVSYMKRPNYLKTPDGRPMLFLQKPDAEAIAEIRKLAAEAGVADPYIVQNRGPLSLGGDAWCSYGGRQKGWLHPGFDGPAYLGKGPTIPHCDVRMNSRPRDEMDYPHHDDLYRDGKLWLIPDEKGKDRNNDPDWFANELHQAIRWTARNSQTVPAQAVLMYCWDEHAEGGLLAPTLGYGRQYVEAIRRAIDGQAPTPVLEAHWAMNGNADDVAAGGHDTAGLHDGKLTGGAAFGEGRTGKALVLDGRAAAAVVPDEPFRVAGETKTRAHYIDTGLDGQEAFTLTAWVRLDRLPAEGRWFFLWSKEGAYRLGVGDDGRVMLAAGTTDVAWYGPGAKTESNPGAIAADGKWHHVAGVYDGRRLRAYVDGKEVAVNDKPISGAIADTDSPLRLGNSRKSHAGLAGRLEDVRLYYGAMAPATIADRAAVALLGADGNVAARR
jgi:hypothetical protein